MAMNNKNKKWIWAACAVVVAMAAQASDLSKEKIAEIAKSNHLSAEQKDKLEKALRKAPFASQGVPSATRHPESREQCERENIATGKLIGGESDVEQCGYANMAVVPSKDGKKVCIDRYEFPNVPCDYPVTWVQANQAAEICEAEGKRLCDAHEWEAACSNTAQPQDWEHPGNGARKKTWAYGDQRQPELCAFGQPKSPGCDAAIGTNQNVRGSCGPNSWPSGSFPQCAGALGVYDQHGNVAEHMNLARNSREAGANGGHGVTEMKGSWFVFNKNGPRTVHEDDCVWRAPGWHRTDVMSNGSHANYHLGFRCCSNPK
jgi:sulfatase modifying factor 1